MTPASAVPRLVADVGGTNARLALFDPIAATLSAKRVYKNRDFDSFQEIIARWRADEPGVQPRELALAVACPPTDDRVQMFNMDWSFSVAELARQFDFVRYRVLNDFEAVAMSLPHLQTPDVKVLQAGEPGGAKLAALGPGTGLGGATCEKIGSDWHVSACEPGHTGLTPFTETEWRLCRTVSAEHAHLYTELLVSGPGLERIYAGLAEIGHRRHFLAAAEIANRGLEGSDSTAVAALELFSALLGSVAGDFVLANGAYGGLYLAGGILPRMLDFLENSAFLPRFYNKGAMTESLRKVPIFAITTSEPALLGAAHATMMD